MIAGILLAAGLSSRMKAGNKMLLPYEDTTIVQHCFEVLNESKLDRVVVICSKDVAPLFEAHSDLVINRNPELGMTHSIKMGLDHLSNDFYDYMICLGDMPFIEVDDVNRLYEAHKSSKIHSPISISTFNDKRGHPIIFHSSYKEKIMRHKAPDGLKNLVKENAYCLNPVSFNHSRIFHDIDTWEDYQNLVKKGNI